MTEVTAPGSAGNLSPGRGDGAFDTLMADGRVAHIRPIRDDDAGRLVDFHDGLSEETVYNRFFTFKRHLSPVDVERFTHLDSSRRVALVAEVDGRLAGVGRYDRVGEDEAEVAFVVADAFQGLGLGTLLLEHLAEQARQARIRRFVADTLPTNQRMLGVFRDAGFRIARHIEQGVVRVELVLDPDEAFVAARGNRERVATVASLKALFRPESIAVIGASRNPGSIGRALFENLLRGGFEGTVYPVNPACGHVAGVRTYPDVGSIDGPVELAVIAVPAAEVATVVRSCAAKGVKGLLVISAGFAEAGDAGNVRQREVMEVARTHSMRLVGPNCFGIVNTAPDVSMNATFSPVAPERGTIAFMSQSGALGISILEQAGRLGLGLSSFVSVGNKADVSGNDLLEYWEADPATEVILLYIESFGNPARFARIARRVSATKPIVAVKGGRTLAGSRAARSHTAAAATPDVAVDALFRQAGVIRVDTVTDLFDVARLLAHQPLPSGRRVAIVGNSGGPGILAADACASVGLELADLGADTRLALRQSLLPGATVENPVDLIASATTAQVERALRLILSDDAVDSVLVIWTPPFASTSTAVADVVAGVAQDSVKPVAAAILDPRTAPLLPVAGRPSRPVPVYPFPEPAIRAMGHAADLVAWRNRRPGRPVTLGGIDEAAAAAVVARAGEGWLDSERVDLCLRAFGINTVESRAVVGWPDVREAAAQIGYPVALKASGPTLVHKSEQGGVTLDVRSEAELERAWDEQRRRLGEQMAGSVIQAMIGPGGIEVIVGFVRHEDFGPIVMFGLGGVATELLADRAFRIVPLTDTDASELVHGVRAAPLLEGYRGAPPVDVDALTDLVLRVASMAELLPAIAEMDLNPVLARESGAIVLDARIRIVTSPRPPQIGSRRLR